MPSSQHSQPSEKSFKKAMLFLFRHSPYGGADAREGLEALLSAAAFDCACHALFMNDGVFQLTEKQKTKRYAGKSQEKMLGALPLYGIDTLYVHGPSLQKRALSVRGEQKIVTLSDQETTELIQCSVKTLCF